MILKTGDPILVSHRRMFEHDDARYFVGQVIACEGELIKAQGYTFVRDLSSGYVIKKDERRTKVLSIASPGFLIYSYIEL